MAGNDWEWTSDVFTPSHPDEPEHPCCVPRNPRVSETHESLVHETIPRRVTEGGSHLSAPNYCLRYRPAARQGEAVDTPTGTSGSDAWSEPGAVPTTIRSARGCERHQDRDVTASVVVHAIGWTSCRPVIPLSSTDRGSSNVNSPVPPRRPWTSDDAMISPPEATAAMRAA